MSNRIEKVNDLVRDNLSSLLAKELNLKSGVFVSVLKVDTSRDLRYARVSVSVFPEHEQDYAEKTLRKELYRIQGLLNKTLQMKILPRVEFVVDNTQQKVSELENLFEQIKKEKE